MNTLAVIKKRLSLIREDIVIPIIFDAWMSGARIGGIIKTIPNDFRLARHFFVVGCSHSGTSILTALISNHPAVKPVEGESNLFRRGFWHRKRVLLDWREMWQPGSVLIEKTPRHLFHTKAIKSLFPHAVIVGITRNPWDNIASLKKRYKDFGSAKLEYQRANETMLSALEGNKIDCFLRYEELVVKPEESLTKIFSISGLAWDRQILQNQRRERHWYTEKSEHERLRNWQISQPLFDGRGKYKLVLTENEIWEISQDLQNLAQRLGHSDKPS